MGRERTLLERLADPETNAPLTISENTELMAESIIRHLQRMLNTRQGHVLTQPEYGMPDVTEFIHSLPDAVNEVRRAIRKSIEEFEPRLRNVEVNVVEIEQGSLQLKFEVTAELVTEKEEASVWFETAINSAGQIRVKG